MSDELINIDLNIDLSSDEFKKNKSKTNVRENFTSHFSNSILFEKDGDFYNIEVHGKTSIRKVSK